MSQQLINHSLDLSRLRDEGYSVCVRAGHLVLDQVPYLNSRGEIGYGMLVSELTLSGERTAKPGSHVVKFAGEHPCGCDGHPLRKIVHQSRRKDLGENLVVDHSFSSKPTTGQYEDYHHRMTTYFALISGPAKAKFPEQCRSRAIVSHVAHEEDVFEYLDTASSQAGINRIANKLRKANVAIVGLGGTGSYVLDLVAKTPVKQIHLYDGDAFLQHNAFRSAHRRLFSFQYPCSCHPSTSLPSTVINQEAVVSPIIGTEGALDRKLEFCLPVTLLDSTESGSLGPRVVGITDRVGQDGGFYRETATLRSDCRSRLGSAEPTM